MSWRVASTFVVPVLLFEGEKIRAAEERSKEIIREKWGTSISSNFPIKSSRFLPIVAFVVSMLLLAGYGAGLTSVETQPISDLGYWGPAENDLKPEWFILPVLLTLTVTTLAIAFVFEDVLIAALYVFAVDDTVGEPSDRAVFALGFR